MNQPILRWDISIAAIALIAFILIVPVFTYFYFANDLQTKETIMNRNNTGIILTDRNGKPFFSFYQAKHAEIIPLTQIPLHMQQAVIAVEDKEFYQHPGFSLKGILRSFFVNLRRGEVIQGGSTITQQLVKNALLSPERSFLRKYQELVLAQELERKYSKNEILTMYLNSVYFGKGAFGVEQAARIYFAKSAQDLNLAESSFLAGILSAPSKLTSPERQVYVLNKMVEQNMISQKQSDEAFNTPLQLVISDDGINSLAPHFAIMVREELIQRYGEEYVARSGFVVKTTLDLAMQEYAESTIKRHVARLNRNRATNASLVAIESKTGEIKALVGSIDWFNAEFGKVNVAVMPRQPGSSFKPIVYLTAFEQHLITPATVLKDQPTSYGPASQPYRPQNFDGRFRGSVMARRALANSLNVPTIEVTAKVGITSIVDMAKRLGLTTINDPAQYGLALGLGAGEVKLLELTGAYSTLANNGVYNKPSSILAIQDKHSRFIYTYQPENKRVVDASYAFLITSILTDRQTRSEIFGNSLDINHTSAVKTGTTQNFRDAWTMGYTPSLTIGVWVGNNNGRPMDNIAGSLGAAPIWKDVMEHSLDKIPDEKFQTPIDIVALSICANGGRLQGQNTSGGRTEYFVAGTEPSKTCTIPTPDPQITQIPPAPQVDASPAPTSTSEPQNQTSSTPNSETQGIPAKNNSHKRQKD